MPLPLPHNASSLSVERMRVRRRLKATTTVVNFARLDKTAAKQAVVQ